MYGGTTMTEFFKRVATLLFGIILFPIIGVACVADALLMLVYYLYKGRFLWEDYNPLLLVFLTLLCEGKLNWKNEEEQK